MKYRIPALIVDLFAATLIVFYFFFQNRTMEWRRDSQLSPIYDYLDWSLFLIVIAFWIWFRFGRKENTGFFPYCPRCKKKSKESQDTHM